MKLGIDGFTYDDLRNFAGLSRLALAFDEYVAQNDADLHRRYVAYRHAVQSGAASNMLVPARCSRSCSSAARASADGASSFAPRG